MEYISSNQNQKVKLWKSLSTVKGRKTTGTYLIEGWHLVNEAIKAEASFQAIIGSEEQIENHLADVPHGVPAFVVSEEVVRHISETDSSQSIFAQVSLPNNSFDPTYVHNGRWLLLDKIQDPGNLGTLIRTADSAGFDGVAISNKSSDLFNPKVIRSTQGSIFHLKVINNIDLKDWINAFSANGLNIYGTTVDNKAISYKEIGFQDNFGLILGNEANGVSSELLEKTTINIYIPINGKAESLNVAVAGGILMYALN